MPGSQGRDLPPKPHPVRYLLLVVISGVLIVAVVVPYFPRGTDLYVHVLWPWQVMRCLHTGSLPLWLPDLNAEFGSPGIGLYSPLSPAICGVLGLALDTGGRGVRAALALAAVLVFAVAPGRNRLQRGATACFVLFSPAVLAEFFGRFPVAQLLALPLAWVLLEHAAERSWRWDRDGLLVALLWLMHAPTAVMVGALSAMALLPTLHGPDGATESSAPGVGSVPAVQLALAVVVAAGVSSWHWWPLLAAASDFSLESALTEGLLHPLRNLIGVSGAHLLDINMSMGWAAIGLLAGLLFSGAWRTRRGLLAVAAIFLASLPSQPLWRVLTPLAWLQFPWRWMFPATLLATTAILSDVPERSRARRVLALAAMIVPLAGVLEPRVVRDPALTVRTAPVEAGERVSRSFSGNPLLIDVVEHRPLWWEDLAETMILVGPRRWVLVPDGGAATVEVWRPLRRELVVDSPHAATLILRLLADRHWNVFIDGRPVPAGRWGAALAITMPEGRHEVEVGWRSDPTAVPGVLVALIIVVGIVLRRRRVS